MLTICAWCKPWPTLTPALSFVDELKQLALQVQQEVPLYSGRLDGAYLQGAGSLGSLWAQAGQPLAVTVTAQHPYVEWRQRRCHTPFWAHQPLAFAALRKSAINFAVTALWTGQALPNVDIGIQISNVPQPPRPGALVWEWSECAESYAQRLLVRCLPRTAPAIPSEAWLGMLRSEILLAW